MVTTTTKVPFSAKYKGVRLCDCPDEFLKWCVSKLKESDLCEYATAAQTVLEERAGDSGVRDLESEADRILRKAGFDPSKM